MSWSTGVFSAQARRTFLPTQSYRSLTGRFDFSVRPQAVNCQDFGGLSRALLSLRPYGTKTFPQTCPQNRLHINVRARARTQNAETRKRPISSGVGSELPQNQVDDEGKPEADKPSVVI